MFLTAQRVTIKSFQRMEAIEDDEESVSLYAYPCHVLSINTLLFVISSRCDVLQSRQQLRIANFLRLYS